MTRRLKPKPEVLAARQICRCSPTPHKRRPECPVLAEGTAPGTDASPFAGIDRSVHPEQVAGATLANPCRLTREMLEEAAHQMLQVTPAHELRSTVNGLKVGRLTQDLEIRTNERERVLDVLAQLERIVTATGGYMRHEDQQWLREARTLLAASGRSVGKL